MTEHAPRPHEQVPGAFGFPRPEDERDERVQAALKTLEAGIEVIIDSDTFRSYLETMSRFHKYSFNNALLIMMQRPDATRVAGFHTWEGLGRSVKKGEKAIKIITPRLAPTWAEDPDTGEKKKREILVGWGVGNVFDVSQTDGKPLPPAPKPQMLNGESDAGRALFGQLANLTTELGGKFARQDQRFLQGANGFYQPHNNEIGVSAALRGDAATKTMAHEVGHFVAQHKGFDAKEDVETVAESTAFVVLNHFGIDSGTYSFDYVAGWAQNKDVLRRNLQAIQKTSHQIITQTEQLAAAPLRTHIVLYQRTEGSPSR